MQPLFTSKNSNSLAPSAIQLTSWVSQKLWGVALVGAIILGTGIYFDSLWAQRVGGIVVALWLSAVCLTTGFVLSGGWKNILGVLTAAVLFKYVVHNPWIDNGFVFYLAMCIVVGILIRQGWDIKQDRRDRRIDGLPNWERDELGEAKENYRSDYFRPEEVVDSSKAQLQQFRTAPAKLLGAITTPLTGATVIESTNSKRPAIAVYGSRVALVFAVPKREDADRRDSDNGVSAGGGDSVEEIVEKQLPPGTKCAVFELTDGVAATTAGRIPVTFAEPHELAQFLAEGAPANGDALHGRASHIHHQNLVSLQHNGLYAGGI